MEVSLSYVGAGDGAAASDRVDIAAPARSASAPLRLAHLLVDEYLTLREASYAFHRDDQPKKAFALLSALDGRLEASRAPGIGEERKLVGKMLAQAAYYSGYSGEMPRSLGPLAIRGTWEVFRAQGVEKVRRGDRISFLEDEEMVSVRGGEEEESSAYKVNEKQIFLPEDDLVFDYRAVGDTLTLRDAAGSATIELRRVKELAGS